MGNAWAVLESSYLSHLAGLKCWGSALNGASSLEEQYRTVT